MLLKLREQIVSAASRTTPSTYSLRDGVSFTGLPCPSATVPPLVPTRSSQAAVRGALAGASCSSAASRVRSSATSMS